MKKSTALRTLIILFFLVTLPSCAYYAALERETERKIRTKKNLKEATGGLVGGTLGYYVGDRQSNRIDRLQRHQIDRIQRQIAQYERDRNKLQYFIFPERRRADQISDPNRRQLYENQLRESEFDQAGYSQKRYYQVPDGFALVSQLEQFHPDGTSKTPPDRWATDFLPLKFFSLSSYLKALFAANPGRYRVIAFIVTSQPFEDSKETVTREEAMAWLDKGMIVLPKSIGEQPYTDQHYCTAYIYEFEQPGKGKKPFFRSLSNLTGKDHLEKSRLWAALER